MTLTDRIRRTTLGLLAAALAATLGVTLAPPTQPAAAEVSTFSYSIENRTMMPLSLVKAEDFAGGHSYPLAAPATIPAVAQATFTNLKGVMQQPHNARVQYSFWDEDGSKRYLTLNANRDGGPDDSSCSTDSTIFRCDIALATSSFDDDGTIFILERKTFTHVPVDDITQPSLWRQLVDLCFVTPPAYAMAHCEPTFNGNYRAIMSNTYFNFRVISWLQLPPATFGKPYSTPVHANPSVVDGYPITVTGLPGGLSYDAEQQRIVGTPSGSVGTSEVRFAVTLPDGTTLPSSVGSRMLPVKAGQPGRLLTEGLPVGTYEWVYSAPIAVSGSGLDTTVTVTGLPDGLSYNKGELTGVSWQGSLWGRPKTVGTFPIVFKVTSGGVTNSGHSR